MNKVLLFLALLCAPGAVLAAPVISTLDDQSAVEVTVYNGNLGLVKDTRRVSLPFGIGELRFMDVASGIMPYTVHVEADGEDTFSVLEQNYEYDLMDAQKLMDKYVGRNVKLLKTNEYQDKKETLEAQLLSNNNGPIYKINNEIHLGSPGYVVLPEIPENLVSKPTLMWVYKNKKSKEQLLTASYLTNGIGWRADYVLVAAQDDSAGDISGWVTLDNNSGATYKDAKLKIVAGDVNRVQAPAMMEQKAYRMAASADAGVALMQEHGFFEYHMYDLPNKTTIKDKQSKQLALLQAPRVKLRKEYIVAADVLENYYWGRTGQDGKIKLPVDVRLTFKNSTDNNLGMPFPQGTIRIYKEDHDKSLQFVGEDAIDHTPKDEDISLKVGKAFDVVAESRQTDFRQIDSWTFESEWEITIRNHKEVPVTVAVIEPVSFGWSNFEIVSSTHPHKKLNVSSLRFDVDVAKDHEAVLKYRVRVKRG